MEIPLAYTVVTGIGEYVSNELVNSIGGKPERIVLATPGSIAWDSCDCGQFIQTINSVVGSRAFPTPATDQPIENCGHPLVVVSVTTSLVRCIPGIDQNGNAPRPDVLLDAALILESDRLVLRRALECVLHDLAMSYRITNYTLGVAQSVGPEGQCGGVEVGYSFGVNNNTGCC